MEKLLNLKILSAVDTFFLVSLTCVMYGFTIEMKNKTGWKSGFIKWMNEKLPNSETTKISTICSVVNRVRYFGELEPECEMCHDRVWMQ